MIGAVNACASGAADGRGGLSGGDEGAAIALAAPALGSPGWPGSPLALAGLGGPMSGGGALNSAQIFSAGSAPAAVLPAPVVCGVCSSSCPHGSRKGARCVAEAWAGAPSPAASNGVASDGAAPKLARSRSTAPCSSSYSSAESSTS